MSHYFVSAVVSTLSDPPYYAIMEGFDGKEECIAIVPFNNHIRPSARGGQDGARNDAALIVKALNEFYEKRMKK